MKQLSVVPTAWIADQMEEEENGHHGNQKVDAPLISHYSHHKCLNNGT